MQNLERNVISNSQKRNLIKASYKFRVKFKKYNIIIPSHFIKMLKIIKKINVIKI
jgi:hypothetical protein